MAPTCRPMESADLPVAGRLLHDAFARAGGTSDFDSVEAATAHLRALLARPHHRILLALEGERPCALMVTIVSGPIAAVGHTAVDRAHAGQGLGRFVCEQAYLDAKTQGCAGLRLFVEPTNASAFAIYAPRFDARATYVVATGPALALRVPGVRKGVQADLPAAERLGEQLLGFARTPELREALARGELLVLERAGRLDAYAAGLGPHGHVLGHADADVEALLAAAPRIHPRGVLLPVDRPHLLRWCLEKRWRLDRAYLLLSAGLYAPPAGCYLPSLATF